ncbi:TPA: hypothetical protein N0F65_012517 [Lagenidium giganteum]|uniref:Protein kinase domain-containing protein n=1 Tax=Lagenidium giganteum TaxID=4803 RepID=A0AAV2YFK4_9STRA|nr:TPA: hypothetical protein N0F65_012517 [Lagenidium giganteum]
MGLWDSDRGSLKEHRSSFLTNSTSCSYMSAADSDCNMPSRYSSYERFSCRHSTKSSMATPASESDDQPCMDLQRMLFHSASVRVMKQAPLPHWMHVFVPRIVRLQAGPQPYLEYARSEMGEVRKRKRITMLTRVERLPKNKLEINFQPYATNAKITPSAPPASAPPAHYDIARSSGRVGGSFDREKWVLRFQSKQERDVWAKELQDTIELLTWISKFSMGKVLMESSVSTITECFTWLDTSKPSFVMKSMKIENKSKSSSARNEVLLHHKLTNFSSHPNVLHLHDSFRQTDNAYLILENCVGGDLFEHLRKFGAMSELDAKKLFRHVLSALEYIHDQGVVHLDIKPENIFFKISALQLETVKLGDFGSARLLSKLYSSKQPVSCTVGYAAPEVLLDGEVSTAADMFSMGAVLYTVLCGFAPFQAPSEEEVQARTVQGDVSFIDPEWWNVSHSARDLVRRLLSVDPNHRPSISEVLEHPWLQL